MGSPRSSLPAVLRSGDWLAAHWIAIAKPPAATRRTEAAKIPVLRRESL